MFYYKLGTRNWKQRLQTHMSCNCDFVYTNLFKKLGKSIPHCPFYLSTVVYILDFFKSLIYFQDSVSASKRRKKYLNSRVSVNSLSSNRLTVWLCQLPAWPTRLLVRLNLASRKLSLRSLTTTPCSAILCTCPRTQGNKAQITGHITY